MAAIAGTAALVSALKSKRPSSLSVTTADGETKPVAIPERRRKWVAVREILDGLEWVKVEALDKKGQVVGLYENGEYEKAHEDDEIEMPDVSAKVGEVAALVALNLKAQDVALRRHNDAMSGAFKAYEVLLKLVTERLIALESNYANSLQMAHDAAVHLGGDDSKGPGELSAPMMLQMFAQLKQLAPGLGAKPKPETA